MKAYFSYINSRKGPDGRRGVYGRQIVFKYYDDGYNPANSVQLTRKLVEEDKVFAVVGSLGTEVNLATRPYLNARKVPQMLVSTGATVFSEADKYPWTGGWQPNYEYEGRLYGQAIARNSPNAKIAILYQNDSYSEDYMKGLRTGLGAKSSNIAAQEGYEVTAADVRTQIAKLRGSGANVLVIIATPRFAIQAYAIANAIRWSPSVIYTNSVSATDSILTLAKSSGGGDLREPDVHGAVREGPGESHLGQRRGDEALQAGDGQVQPARPRDRRAQLLRRRRSRGVRRADVQGGEEPDPRVADEGVPQLERAQPVPAPGQPAEDRRGTISCRSNATAS